MGSGKTRNIGAAAAEDGCVSTSRGPLRFGLVAVALAVAAAVTSCGTGVLAPPSTGSGATQAAPAPTPAPTNPVTAIPKGEVPLVHLAAVGDTGTADEAERATAAAMDATETGREYDALLLLGDLIYEDGDPARIHDAVFTPFAGVLDGGTQLVPVLGNHDIRRGAQEEIMRALGRAETRYVQQIGPLRIVVLDSTQVDDPQQTAWLEQVLSEPVAADDWTVVAMHHPAYSAGEHGRDSDVLDLRARWAPVFARHRVPLVLAGHDHDYQRSLPQDGVTYVVAGAGAKLRETGSESFTAFSTSVHSFVDLLVFPDRLELRALDQQQQLVDSVLIPR